MERNYKAPRTVPGASSHSATECPFLLPTAPTFHLLFISVNRAELFAKEHQPISELGWERVGQAWAGQVKNRPPALKRLLPAGILGSWAWQGPETARPKAFEQMAVGAWSPQPTFHPRLSSEKPCRRPKLHSWGLSGTKARLVVSTIL